MKAVVYSKAVNAFAELTQWILEGLKWPLLGQRNTNTISNVPMVSTIASHAQTTNLRTFIRHQRKQKTRNYLHSCHLAVRYQNNEDIVTRLTSYPFLYERLGFYHVIHMT